MRTELGRWVATVLRVGTLAAMLVVALGLAIALFGDQPSPGPRPVVEIMAGGTGYAFIAAGLLGLALLPIGVLVAAGVAFLRSGERIPLAVTFVVLVLLVASLVVAAAVGAGPELTTRGSVGNTPVSGGEYPLTGVIVRTAEPIPPGDAGRSVQRSGETFGP